MNEVINTLCEKLGTTVEHLIETMIAYYRMSTAVEMGIMAFLLVSSAVAIALIVRQELRHHKKDDWYDPFDGGWSVVVVTVFGVMALVALIVTMVDIHGYIMLTTNPEGAVIAKLLSALK